MIDTNCIFCKIANGEIPSYTLYEDDMFRVIFDLSPASKGHALVLPKEHFRNLFSLDDKYAEKLMVVVKKVATAMKEVFNCDGFNLLQNNEEIAGQTIFHFHMHLIPRYVGDSVNFTTITSDLDKTTAEDIANTIRERIK